MGEIAGAAILRKYPLTPSNPVAFVTDKWLRQFSTKSSETGGILKVVFGESLEETGVIRHVLKHYYLFMAVTIE